MHDKLARLAAATIDDMLRELLICMIDRSGGAAAIAVDEVEAAKGYSLSIRLEEGWFIFETKPKPVSPSSGPGYPEH